MDAAKLAELRANLVAVEEALAVEGESEELQKAKECIEEVLEYYKTSVNHLDLVGRACVVGPKKHAIIERIGQLAEDDVPQTIYVRHLQGLGDAEDVEEIDVSKVRLINQFDLASLTAGAELQALFSDGVWYNCTVKAILKGQQAVRVVYDDYDEEEDLAADRVRARPKAPKNAAAASAKPADTGAAGSGPKTIITPGGYRIPSSLIVKPGDTTLIKQTKRKKLEALKREQREKKHDEEARERQAAWKQHCSAMPVRRGAVRVIRK